MPDDFFSTVDHIPLNSHLSCSAIETRKTDGSKYPPATIHHLLCGLLRHKREVNSGCLNILNKKDSRFKQLHGTLDVLLHKATFGGTGHEDKECRYFTLEEEKLWNSGVLSLSTPKTLQNAAFYTIGKMFCLRGGVEHGTEAVTKKRG